MSSINIFCQNHLLDKSTKGTTNNPEPVVTANTCNLASLHKWGMVFVCVEFLFNTGERVSLIFQGETSFSTSLSWPKIRYPNGKKVSCGAHLMGDQIATAPLDTNEERKAITEIINHPNYNDVTLDNDIAVIKVADGDTFNCGANIFPACLPSTNVRSSKCPLRSLISNIVGIRLCWLAGHHCFWLGYNLLGRIRIKYLEVGQCSSSIKSIL